MSLKVSYDAEYDLFYLGEDGFSAEVVEIYPGVNLDLDSNDALVGVEVWAQARQLLGPAIEPLLPGGSVSQLPLHGSLADLDAQLRPAYGQGYRDYLEVWPDCTDDNHPEALKALHTLRCGINAILEQIKDGTAIS